MGEERHDKREGEGTQQGPERQNSKPTGCKVENDANGELKIIK